MARTVRSRLVTGLAVVAALLSATAAVTPATTAVVGGTWQPDTLQPVRVSDGALRAVDCVSDTFCVAVGRVPDGENGGERALTGAVQQWDGTAWTVVPLPNRGEYGGLSGVSCVSTRFCIAVGGEYDAPLILRWNGVRWRLDDVGGLPRAELADVDCASARSCVAVGVDHGEAFGRAAVLRFDGGAWTADTAAALPNDHVYGLAEVACPTVNRCLAVGNTGPGTSTPVAEVWDGATWTITPFPRGTSGSAAWAVTCTGPTACLVVGQARAGSFVASWNGTAWTLGSDAAPRVRDVALYDIACRAPGDCLAVGVTPAGAFAEHLAGTAWSVVTLPAGSATSTFDGVACTGPTAACAVVGAASLTSPACCSATLVDHFDGVSLTAVPSPSPQYPVGVSLADVDCVTTTDCTGVGLHGGLGRTISAVEHWNGIRWTLRPVPSDLDAGGGPAHVSCADASSCLAIDVRGRGALRFDGSSWTTVPGPWHRGDLHIQAVECVTAGFCLAVGSAQVTPPGGSPTAQPLVRRWDGNAWTQLPTPTTPSGGELYGVSCTSTTSCIAVGAGFGPAVALRWDGTTWSTLTTAVPADGVDTGALLAVSCAAANVCMAVGNYQRSADGAVVPLLERWNGRTWGVLRAPRNTDGADLQVVSCASTTACTAGGSTAAGGLVPTAFDWDGTHWTLGHLGGGAGGTMRGLSCAAARTCKATGVTLGAQPRSGVVSETP